LPNNPENLLNFEGIVLWCRLQGVPIARHVQLCKLNKKRNRKETERNRQHSRPHPKYLHLACVGKHTKTQGHPPTPFESLAGGRSYWILHRRIQDVRIMTMARISKKEQSRSMEYLDTLYSVQCNSLMQRAGLKWDILFTF
jgi:hypothetical protein